jgi:hypothetical protein
MSQFFKAPITDPTAETGSNEELDAFIKKFTSLDGKVYKLCPKEWLITDQGFGVDLQCCQGDC